ncbi:MAG: InlB B-repeat-containing protein [Clostridia bacterium]|nr:InlB B-repeat-containing protein [Clostridia bacterium]
MMKTKFSSRVIALILTLGMLITCFPTFTFAEDAVAQTDSGVSPDVDVTIEKIADLEQYLIDWSKQLYIDIKTTSLAPNSDTVNESQNRVNAYNAYSKYGIFQTTTRPNRVVLDDENQMVAFDETGLQAYLDNVAGYSAYKMRSELSNYGELYNDFVVDTGTWLNSSRKLMGWETSLYFGSIAEQEKIIPVWPETYSMVTYNPFVKEGLSVICQTESNSLTRWTGFSYQAKMIDPSDSMDNIGLNYHYPLAKYPAGTTSGDFRDSVTEPIVVEYLFYTKTDDFGAQVISNIGFDAYEYNESTGDIDYVGEEYRAHYVRGGYRLEDVVPRPELNLSINGVEDFYYNSSDNEFATNGWYPPRTSYEFFDANGESIVWGEVRDGYKLTGNYPASVAPTSAMLEDEEYTYTFKGWVAADNYKYDASFAAANLINGPVVDFGKFEFIADSYAFVFYPTFTKQKKASGDLGDDTKPETQSNIETFENGIYGIVDGVIEYAPEGFTSATITATDMNKYNQYTAGVNNNAYAELAGAGNNAFTIAKGMEASFDFASKSVVNNDIVKFSFDYYYPGGNMANAVEADIFKIYNKETGKVAARLYASRGANKANFLMIADGLNYDDDYTANEVTNERAMGFPFNTQGTQTANYKASYYIRNSAGNYTNFGIDRANITGWRMDQAKWQHFDIYLDTINGVYYVMVDGKLLAKANFVDADVNSVDAINMAAGTVYESAAYDNIAISELGYHTAFPTSDITVKDAATGDTLVTVQDAEFGRIVALPEINGEGRLTGVYKDAEASAYADRAYNKNGNNSYYGGYIVEPVVGDVTLYATFDNTVSSDAEYTLDASGDAVITRNKITSGTNMNYIRSGNPQGINFADRNWSYTATGDEIGGFAKISGSWEAGTVDLSLEAYADANNIGAPDENNEAKFPLISATDAADKAHSFVYFLNPITENRNANDLVLEMADTATLGAGNKIRMSYDVKLGYLAEATYSDVPATVKFGSVMGAVAKNAQGTTLEQNIPVLSMTADERFGLAVYDGSGFKPLVAANAVTGKWLTIVYDFDTVLKKTVITVKEGATVLATQTVNFLDNNGKQADRITSFVWGANNSTHVSTAYLDNFKVEENPVDNAAAVVEPTYLNKVIFHHNGNNLNDWSVRYVADGATATTVGMTANPTKNPDTNYSYNFQGWSTGEEDQADAYYTGITNVTKDLEVAPMWEKSTQKYTVTIVDSAEQTLSTQEVQAYTAPTYPGDQTKAATATTEYVFKGWFAKAGSHIGNKLLNADGTTLFVDFTDATEEELATIGTTVEVNNIKYTIADFAAMQVTGDSTLKPLFEETYADAITVNFYNEAGTQVYATRTTGRGMTILNMPANPTKANNNDGTFTWANTFDGWYTGTYPNGEKVTPTDVNDATKYFTENEVSLYPHFSQTKTAVRVILYNDDNTKLFDGYVGAGNKPNYTAIPKKTSTSDEAYTFNGWKACDVDGVVAGDATLYEYAAPMTKSNEALPATVVATAENVYYYKASYASGEKQYVITFYDNAGAVLGTSTVAYGDIAGVAVPEVPTAAANAQYTYSDGAWPYVANNALVPEEVAAAKAYINAEGNFVVDIYAEYVKTPVANIPDTMETFEDVEITLLPNTNIFAINNSKLITKLGNNGNTATYARNQGDGLAHNVFGIVGEPGNATNNVVKIYNAKTNQGVGTVFYFDPATADSINGATVTYKFKVKNVYETGFPTRFALGLQGQTTAGANRTITNIATDGTTGNLVLTNGAGVPKYMDNPSIGYSVDTMESAGKNTWFDVAFTFNFATNSYKLAIGEVESEWITAAETVTNIDRLVVTTGTSAQNLDYTMYIDDLAIEGLKETSKSQFTVSYLSDDGNANSPVRGTEVVAMGEDAPTLIDYDRSSKGYRLNGWTLDGETVHTKANPITNVTANLNPYAVWSTLKSYEVNFYEKGALLASLPEVYGGYSINSKWSSSVPATPVRENISRTVTLTDEYAESDEFYGFEAGTVIPQRQIFKGWAITEDGENPLLDGEGNVQILDLDEDLVEGNLKLMAYFDVEDVTYSVKYTLSNGDLYEERIVYPGYTVTVGYGDIPAGPARANDALFAYTFDKWSTDLTGVAINEDMVVYPEYSREFFAGTPYVYEDFTNAKGDYITYIDANGNEKNANFANVQSSFITKSYGKVVEDYKAPANDPYNKIGTNNNYWFEPLDMSKAENQNIKIQVKVRARENLSNWNASDIKIKYEGLGAGSRADFTLGKTIETRPQVFDWITYLAELNYADRTYVLYADGVEIATGELPDMKAIHGVNIGGNFNNWGQIYIEELIVTRPNATELELDEREYTVTYMDADGVLLNVVKVPYGGTTPEYTGITPGYKAGVEFTGWRLGREEIAKDGIVSGVTKNITLVAKYAEKADGEFVQVNTNISGWTANTLENHQINRTYYVGQEVNVPRLNVKQYGVSYTPKSTSYGGTVQEDTTKTVIVEAGKGFQINWEVTKIDITANYLSASGEKTGTGSVNEGSGVNLGHFSHVTDFIYNGYAHKAIGWYTEAPTYDYVNGTCTPNGKKITAYSIEYPVLYAAYELTAVEEGKIAILDGTQWKYYTAGDEVTFLEGYDIVDPNNNYRLRRGDVRIYNAAGTQIATVGVNKEAGAANFTRNTIVVTEEMNGGKISVPGFDHVAVNIDWAMMEVKGGNIVDKTGRTTTYLNSADNTYKYLNFNTVGTNLDGTYSDATFKGWMYTNLLDENDPNNYDEAKGNYFVTKTFMPTGYSVDELLAKDINPFADKNTITIVADYDLTEEDFVTINFVDGNGEVAQTVKWYEEAGQTEPTFSGNATQLVKKADLVEENTTTKYTFASWSEGVREEGVGANGEDVITYTATFTEKVYATITFNIDGVETATDFVVGTNITAATPVKENPAADKVYVFTGWSETEGGEIVALPVASVHATYYANFEEVDAIIITFMDGEDVLGTLKLAPGTLITPAAAPAKSGMVFTGWSADGGETKITSSELAKLGATETVTYVAQYMEVNITGDYVFVAGSGSDANDGLTVDTPVATVKKAYEVAVAEGLDTIYVLTDSNIGADFTITQSVKYYAPYGAAIVMEHSPTHGMTINNNAVVEFNNVTFKYTGTDKGTLFTTNGGSTLRLFDVTFVDGNSKWSAIKLNANAKVEWENVTADGFNMKLIDAANALAEGSYVNNLTYTNNDKVTALPGGHTVIDGLVVKDNTTTGQTLLTINGGTLKNVVMTNNTFAGYGLYSSNGSATTTIQNIVAYGNTSTSTNGWSIFQGQNASSIVFDGKTIAYTDDATVYQNGNAMAKGQATENFVGLLTARYNATQPIFKNGFAATDEQIASVHSSSYATGSGVLAYNKETSAFGLTKSFYTPAYSANNAEYGTVFGGTTVDSAFGKVNVVVIPADGYELTGFTDAEGNELEYTLVETADEALVGEEIYTVTLTGDVDVVAVFNGEIVEEPTKYTITFVVDGETFGTVEVVENEEIVYTATPTKDGHEFAGWALAEDGEVVDSLGVADEAKTFYAIFNEILPETFEINFEVDDVVVKTVTVEAGETPVFGEDPVKEGYTFTGWTPELAPATEDATYVATFEIKTYTITFVVEGLEDTVLTVNHGVVPEIADPVVDGYTFVGWDPEIVAATEDATYEAILEKVIVKYTITFVVEGQDNVEIEVVEGELPAFPGETPSKEGFEFKGWTPEIVEAYENATYTAVFEEISTGDDFPFAWGDVNLDGKVNVMDGATIVNYVQKGALSITSGDITLQLGEAFAVGSDLLWGDVNGDGKVNVMDGATIVNYVQKGTLTITTSGGETKEVGKTYTVTLK